MAGEGGLLMCTWPKGDAARVPAGLRLLLQRVHERLRVPGGRAHDLGRHGAGRAWPSRAPSTTATTPRGAIRGTKSSAATTTPARWPATACSWRPAATNITGRRAIWRFAPRLTPENFRAAFTDGRRLGHAFASSATSTAQRETLELKWGKLRLRSLAFELPGNAPPKSVRVTLNDVEVQSKHHMEGNRAIIELTSETILQAGGQLKIAIAVL